MSVIQKKKTIKLMIDIYCSGKHGTEDGELCRRCAEMKNYMYKRIELCKKEKAFCGRCEYHTHCYAGEPGSLVRDLMRYSGPRLMIKKPVAVLKYLVSGMKK